MFYHFFKGRTIVVDWAIPVKDFKKVNNNEVSENVDEKVEVKEEILSDDETFNDSEQVDSKEHIKNEFR